MPIVIAKPFIDNSWNLDTAVYDGVSKSVSLDTRPQSIFFRPDDGTQFLMVGVNSDRVYTYTLDTGWIVVPSTPDAGKSISGQETFTTGMFASNDGTDKLYLIGGNQNVYQYSFGNSWESTTLTYDSKLKDVSAELGGPTDQLDVWFNPTGTKMYILTNDTGTIYQYTVGTAWDVTTASYDSISATIVNAEGFFFSLDGTRLYAIEGGGSDRVYQYSMSPAWDLSTLSLVTNFFIGSQESVATDVHFKADGTKMYVVGQDDDRVDQYSIG